MIKKDKIRDKMFVIRTEAMYNTIFKRLLKSIEQNKKCNCILRDLSCVNETTIKEYNKCIDSETYLSDCKKNFLKIH